MQVLVVGSQAGVSQVERVRGSGRALAEPATKIFKIPTSTMGGGCFQKHKHTHPHFEGGRMDYCV